MATKSTASKTTKATKPAAKPAAKVARTVVKPAAAYTVGTRTIAKEMRPSDADLKYVGPEPVFTEQPDDDRRQGRLMAAFNWYSRFYGTKQAKEIMVDFLKSVDRQEEAAKLGKAEDKAFKSTFAWLARLSMRGLDLTDSERERLDAEIARLVAIVDLPVTKDADPEDKPATTRPNVQEIMRDKMREAGGEFEGIFDEFLDTDCKLDINGRVIGALSERNVLPQHIGILQEVWQKKVAEFTEVLAGTDAQLKEGYGHYTKSQIKQIIKFCELVIKDLNSYVSVKKASRAPRARKPVPVEKIVKNLKYLKKFESADPKISLESVPPTKLHGAAECFLYDTSKRKIHYLVADEYAKTLSVKGNSVIGFDAAKSQTKTLRKPITLTEFMKLGKPGGRKFFAELTTVATTPNGRFNDAIVILKAW